MFEKLQAKVEYIIQEKNMVINNPSLGKPGIDVEEEKKHLAMFESMYANCGDHTSLRTAIDQFIECNLTGITREHATEFFSDDYKGFVKISDYVGESTIVD